MGTEANRIGGCPSSITGAADHRNGYRRCKLPFPPQAASASDLGFHAPRGCRLAPDAAGVASDLIHR